MIIYTVRSGDNLYSIGQKYGIQESELQQANQIQNGQSLTPGQALVIPVDMSVYEVEPGETLLSIARKFGTTVERLLLLNPGITDPSQIRAGENLIIPHFVSPTRQIIVNGYALPNIALNTLNMTLPHLTFLSIFSYEARADGSVVPLDDRGMIQAAYRQAVAPLMTLTNIKEGGGFDSDLAHTILTDEQVQNTLLLNVIQEMNARSYFGLNVDFEYIYPGDREAYNDFLRKTYQLLHPIGFRMMTALAPKTYADQPGLLYEAHDYAAHGQIVDWVILMTYEWGYTLARRGYKQRARRRKAGIERQYKIVAGGPAAPL